MKRRDPNRLSWSGTDAEISMTPMIDVVFQLLIYFLVTFSAMDVLSFMDISRPAPDASKPPPSPPADMIRIAVLENGYAINGRNISRDELYRLLGKLASVSKKQTVLVSCENESFHGRLIEVLDMCASCELTQIAVISGQ